MTIQQLLDMPIGEKTGGGFVLVAKKAGKTFGSASGLMQSITFTDASGDIAADVLLKGNSKIVRTEEIKIIVCKIQCTVGEGKKLYVDQWEKVTCTADELPERDPLRQNGPNWDAISRGKVKCRLIEAAIKNGILALDPLSTTDKVHNTFVRAEIARNADWVMSPEDKYEG